MPELILQQPPASVPKEFRRRTTQYDEHRFEILRIAKELGLSGATNFEICQQLEITEPTLHAWRARYPEFREALQLAKDIADGNVEASLYHKARGYTYRSEKIFQHDGQIIRAETVEHVPPDTTSMIFWLKNRQREKWRDQQNIDMGGTVDVNHKVDPRQLALALLATLRAAAEAGVEAPQELEANTDAK